MIPETNDEKRKNKHWNRMESYANYQFAVVIIVLIIIVGAAIWRYFF
jgi:hypothetical protein